MFFAISYLRGTALDYFELFINEPDPYQCFDFLEDWTTFAQKLSNVFGSYLLENNNKNAIMAIVFPNEGKAVNYFIQFTKYQNQICWDDHFLQKVVKDALPLCMRDKLRFSHENVLFFKGLKRAILRINNNYWKHQLENKNKSQTTCTLQIYPSKNLCLNPSRPSSTPERITNSDR